jgi:hypothetical protein
LLRCQIPEILVGEGVAYPSQVHDGRHHVPEPGTDPLVHRRRRGSDEANCSADGWWSGDLIPDGTNRLPGALRAMEIPHVAAVAARHPRVAREGTGSSAP